MTLEFTAAARRGEETENCLGPPALSGPPLGGGLYWPLGRPPQEGGGGRPQDSGTRPPDT